ncbi:MAG: nodulation protein NfeD [Chloroflexi bacterium]|nr:nodulation protein NfeD [Chloroflexota bacterium]
MATIPRQRRSVAENAMRNTTLRLALGILSAVALAMGIMGMAQARDAHVLLLRVNGVINDITDGYIARGVRRAEEDGARLLIIELDTPGGLLDSTRSITQSLLDSQVPNVVYVSPSGARAASAGAFIAAAATFAVMSPGTNIGAASPVASGGEDLPATLKSKAFSDAAAEMRGIAELRGRNKEKLEAMVTQAISLTAEEALASGVIDLVAADMGELLAGLHGREAIIRPPGGQRLTLDTQGLVLRTMEMSPVERFLGFISDPNVSFLLLSLGGLGLLLEMLNPGMVLPGVAGAILLVLAFLALGNLPVNWAGVALMLLAVLLAVLELYVAGFGALGVGAIVSFALGSFLLFFHAGGPSPTMPHVSVSLWVMVPTMVILGSGGAWLISTIIRSRREPAREGPSPLVGATGYTLTELSPRGVVQVGSEQWSAVAETRVGIPKGCEVRVTQARGATLTVAPANVPLVDGGDGNPE